MLLGLVVRVTTFTCLRRRSSVVLSSLLTPTRLLLSKEVCFTSYCHNLRPLKKKIPTHRTKVELTESDMMQPASASVSSDMAAAVSEEDADEDVTTEARVMDKEDQLSKCAGEAVAAAACEEDGGLDRREENEDVRLRMMMSSGQRDPLSSKTQETEPTSTTTTTTTTLPAPDRASERKRRRKLNREKRKLTMKSKAPPPAPPPAASLDSLMSELPFAFASSAVWKDLGFVQTESTEKKRRKRKMAEGGGGRVESEEDTEKTSKKKKKQSPRPNYFVSLPITSTQIISAVAEIQKAVLQQEPRLAKAMIPVPTLHITLLVTHLANQEQIDMAAAALAQLKPSLAELLGGRDLVLSFSGIGHFRKEVVFMGLEPGWHRDTLDRLAEVLRSCFEAQGLMQGDQRGFEPHLTIMKLSKAPKLRSQGVKRVDPALYSSYTDRCFGEQPVEKLDLCSMLKKKQENGYYHTETSLQLGGGENQFGSESTPCQTHKWASPFSAGRGGAPEGQQATGGGRRQPGPAAVQAGDAPEWGRAQRQRRRRGQHYRDSRCAGRSPGRRSCS